MSNAMKKSQRVLSRLLVVAVSAAAGAGALAQSNLPGASMGYVGLNAGQSNFRLDSGTGLFSADTLSTAYSLYTGGYFSNNFGVEVGYIDFGRVNRGGGSTKADGFNLSLIGKLPTGGSFNLLGRIGTIYGRSEVSSSTGSGIVAGTENVWDWSYGVGAEYLFNPNWSGVLQYDEHYLKFPGTGRDRITNTSLGARYRF